MVMLTNDLKEEKRKESMNTAASDNRIYLFIFI